MDALIPRRGIPTFKPPYPKDGLIAEYLFKDSGTTVEDTSLSGFNGTAYNATHSDGKAVFSGVYTSYIDIPSGLTRSNVKSISLWAKAYSLPSSRVVNMFCLIDSSANCFGFQIKYDGKVSVWTGARGNTHYNFLSTNSLSTNTLYHIVMTIADDTATGVKIYINGTQASTTYTSDSASANTGTGQATLGSGTNASTQYLDPMNGELQKVRIYNRVITSDEVAQLYNNGTPR